MNISNHHKKYFVTLFLCCFFFYGKSQKLISNGGLLLKTELTFGNQNQWLKIGVTGFGIANYNNIATEAGFSFSISRFLKRHNIKTNGWGTSYEFFGMLGSGSNENLLGSSVSNMDHTVLFDPNEKSSFKGIGFGFEKESYPENMKSFGIRRGKFLLRFSDANSSFHMAFLNDFKAGKLFYGEGTDYAETGTLIFRYTNVRDPFQEMDINQIGFGITLFTPQADYSKSPRNPVNSDDGRKNVWYTKEPHKDAFYANTYFYFGMQRKNFQSHFKLGNNSQKMGAYLQNKLHDGFGLNPRYPWNTQEDSKIYYEFSATTFLNTIK